MIGEQSAFSSSNKPLPSLDSPPGMTISKSSKSSSFHSFDSEDGSVLADIGHFEDIGLGEGDDDKERPQAILRPGPVPINPFSRNLATGKHMIRPRRSSPNLQNHVHASNVRSASLMVLPDARPVPVRAARSTGAIPLARRHRSASPGLTPNPRYPNYPIKPRRGSWQSNRDRKSPEELENECDEDDGDDIPEGIILDNVPLSPRPAHSRPLPPRPVASSSPDGRTKERIRSVGNGTPPVAQARGSLRSPSWRSAGAGADKTPPSPSSGRVGGWKAAMAELSSEAKVLTEKLEEHADEAGSRQATARRPAAPNRPCTWDSNPRLTDQGQLKKTRVKSSTPELPPLRRVESMVDPLPISKEKEAVLSRTRPSWLPPKDPVEEKRHLKEYQKMMVASARAEEQRAAARRARTEWKDKDAGSAMRIWEEDILPRWNEAMRERRTREMWWKGVAPRSRGAVWRRAIGNELGLSAATFDTALRRAREVERRVERQRGDAEDERRAKWLQRIREDVGESTWRELRIFSAGGPLHQGLVDVLSAYAMYRNDIGYVRGSHTIAALLLLNMPDAETAFVALANVLNRPLPLSFLTSDQGAQSSVYNLVMQTVGQKSRALHEHLTRTVQEAEPELYLGHMFTTLFTGYLALDEATRLWDVYVFEGDGLLVQAAVAVLLSREMALLGSKTGDEVKAVLLSSSSAAAAAEPGHGEGGGGPGGGVETEEGFMRAVREAGRA